RDAGLGSIPGTAAEILDDDVREILSHKKVDVAAWVEIITTAHARGGRTLWFSEFVPLRFIHENTVLYRKGLVKPSEVGLPDLRMYATSRLFLRGFIDNLQTSWVKLG